MAIARNLRVKLRLSALESEIALKGDLDTRPARERTSKKVVTDSPVIEIPFAEYQQRLADAQKVLNRGWQLIEDDPPEVWIGPCAIDPLTGIASLAAKVVSNNVSTTCGFEIDSEPGFTAPATEAAAETPVQSADPEKITATYDLSSHEGSTYYVRAFANDGTKTVYSHVKSIEIPIIP